MKRIYLDNAATTALEPQVLDAMMPFLTERFGNPSAPGQEGRIARIAVEKSRKDIAALLHTHPSQLIFTSGGTEANNLAIRGLIKAYKISRVISSPLEHSSVSKTLSDLSWSGQIELVQLTVDKTGHPNLAELESLLKDGGRATLVSLMHANNEIGTMIDLYRVGALVKQYHAFFHSDTVQTMGHYPLDLSAMPTDLLTLSAHKFHGPKGCGLLWKRADLGLHVMQTGGGHEHGLRGGTENVASIVGMARAFSIAMEHHSADKAHILRLRRHLRDGLEKLGAVIHGPASDQGLYTVLNAGFVDCDSSKHILLELDIAGISVSAGSACNTGKGSKVMEAIGADHLINIRFSFSRDNQIHELDRVLAILQYQLQGSTI